MSYIILSKISKEDNSTGNNNVNGKNAEQKSPQPELGNAVDFVQQVMTDRGLSRENLVDMKALFDLFDIDGDGSISITELETVMKTMGQCPPSIEEIRQMMIDFDEDGNEVIDFNEFKKMMEAHKEKTMSEPDAELRNALRIFDKQHSGSLTAENVQTILTKMGDEAISKAEADEFLKFAKLQKNTSEISIDDLINVLMSS